MADGLIELTSGIDALERANFALRKRLQTEEKLHQDAFDEVTELKKEVLTLKSQMAFDDDLGERVSYSNRYLAKKLVELSSRSFESWMVEAVDSYNKEAPDAN